MSRFNRKFNTRRKSLERWQKILSMLSSFEGVINSYDGASPEEICTLKAIHRKLYECSMTAKAQLKEADIAIAEYGGKFRKERNT